MEFKPYRLADIETPERNYMKVLTLPIKFLAVLILLGFSFSSCKKNAGKGNNNSSVDIVSNLEYGSNKDINGATVQLKLDVYMPGGATALDKYPLILFVHGGGFTEGDKSSYASQMINFAKSGFVAVAIDYRLNNSSDKPCDIDSNVSKKIGYMAIQDARAAMRYMVANAEQYHVDVSQLFLSGNSAGAVTVLNSYFPTQDDFNTMLPGIEDTLGSIDNADNDLTNAFSITAIAANSGCLGNPAFITSSNLIPVIFFHGGADNVIPIDEGNTYNCPHSEYVYGSQSLYNRIAALSGIAVLHVDPSGGHLPYTQSFIIDNETCFFNSVIGKETESGSFTGQQSSCK